MNEKDIKTILDTQKKWEASGLLDNSINSASTWNISFPKINSINSASNWNISFPKILGSEPREHVKKRKRYEKMKRLFGDNEFFKIVDKKTYEDFINEEFLPSARTIAQDLVSVQPMNPPTNSLISNIDYKYGDDDSESDN
jgi:hypothetical protein